MRNAFVGELCNVAKKNRNVCLITGDLGFNVLNKFWELYPNNFINAGICEQNMTSVAAGLALEGKCVFTYSIANFPTMRCLEQIRNDVAYHDVNVNIVSVGAGFSYGSLGMSHHATEDLAIMRAIPNIIVFTPCDPLESAVATKIAAETKHPCYIRLGRGGEKNLNMVERKSKIGGASILKNGTDVVILVAGAVANEAVRAANDLENMGISCMVIAFFTIKPIDEDMILNVSKNFKNIITLEEHNIIGGLGSAVAEVCTMYGCTIRLYRLGLQDEFTTIVGSQEYLRGVYGISANNIVDMVKKINLEDNNG